MIIRCEDCKEIFEHIPTLVCTNRRRFCDRCSSRRKYEKITFSNRMRVKVKEGKGRPKKIDSKEIIISNMIWDEANEPGY